MDINLLMNWSSVAKNQHSWERTWKAKLESILNEAGSTTPSLGMTWQTSPVLQAWHLFFCPPSPSPSCRHFYQLPNQKSWLSGQTWSWLTDQLQHLRTEQWTEWTAALLQVRWSCSTKRIPNNIWQIYIHEKEPWSRGSLWNIEECMLSLLQDKSRSSQVTWKHDTKIKEREKDNN